MSPARSTALGLLIALAVAVAWTGGSPVAAQDLPGDEESAPADGSAPLVDEIEDAEQDTGRACADERLLLQPGCQVMEGVLGGVGGVVQGGAMGALRAIVEWVVDTAGWLLGQLAELIDATTTPDVQAGWFDAAYGQMTLVAVTLMLPLVLLSTIQALTRANAAHLTRVFFVYVPVAVLGMFAATAVVAMLLAVTDELSAWVGSSVGGDLSAFTTNLGTALTATTGPTSGGAVPGFAALLAALIVGFATLVIWVLLVLRQAAVYAGVLFLPLAFAGLVWPAAAGWFKRLAEGLVAIIFAKFVIVAVLAMAASALAAMGVSEGYGVVVAGGSLLMMAVFAPFVLLRLIPVFGSELASTLDGVTTQRTSPIPAAAGQGIYRQIAAANSAKASAAGPGGLAIAGGAAAAGAAGSAVSTVKGKAADVASHSQDTSGTPPAKPTGSDTPTSKRTGDTDRGSDRNSTPPPATDGAPPSPPPKDPSRAPKGSGTSDAPTGRDDRPQPRDASVSPPPTSPPPRTSPKPPSKPPKGTS